MSNKVESIAALGAALQREFPRKLNPAQCGRLAAALWSCGNTATRIATNQCNLANYDAKRARESLRRRLSRIFERHGVKLSYRISGDPRGYCLKLMLRRTGGNTWGGDAEGYGVGS